MSLTTAPTDAAAVPRHRRALEAGARLGPGLALTAVAVAVAAGIHALVAEISPLTAAVVLGVLCVNVGAVPAACAPGTRFAAKRLLRVGVVLLGLQLAVSQLLHLGGRGLAVVVVVVLGTFFGTQWLGHRLGVPRGQALLIATGFSVCGVSAIAAMEGAARDEDTTDDDVITAITLVTVCGTLAIAVLPALRGVLGLDAHAFGMWTGASVHDVSQVVATAAAVPGAMAAAVVVKLTRVVLLAPLVAAVSMHRRRTAASAPGAKRPPIMPLFVAGFLAMVALRTTGIVPDGVLDVVKDITTYTLAAALFGLGTGVRFASLRHTASWRSVALGGISWVLIAALAYAGVLIAA